MSIRDGHKHLERGEVVVHPKRTNQIDGARGPTVGVERVNCHDVICSGRRDDETSDLDTQPTTLELVELQARIGTVLFSLGAHEQGRLCLAWAATLAEGTAWSPSVDEPSRTPDPSIATEYASWSRISSRAMAE